MIDPTAPAYPHPEGRMGDTLSYGEPGLTIRAEFAARAMQGMVNNISVSTEHDQSETLKRIADLACAQADALIAALNKGEKE